jgi:antitoxin MazE
VIKTRLVRIDNSRGVRLLKPLILEAGLSEGVELRVQEGAIVIAGVALPRSGWSEAAKRLCVRGDDALLNKPTSTRFDETE